MNEKIKEYHLQRKAILYVRQSLVYQVDHNQESRQLQYAMQVRLRMGVNHRGSYSDFSNRAAASLIFPISNVLFSLR